MDKKTKAEFDRRMFLKSMMSAPLAARMTSPLQILMANYFTSMMGKAYAQASGTTDLFTEGKSLVTLFIDGGFPQWYHIPMKPTDSSPFVANDFIGTTLNAQNKGVYTNTSLNNPLFNNIKMPALWGGKIPTANGSYEDSAQVAEHMCMVRGIYHEENDHVAASRHMYMPSGDYSLPGVAADNSSAPIAALGVGHDVVSGKAGVFHSGSFVSKKGKSLSFASSNYNSSSSHAMQRALTPFLNGSDLMDVKSSNGGFRQALENVLNIFKTNHQDLHSFLPTGYQQRVEARNLMMRNLSNVNNQFVTARNIYANLVKRSVHDSQCRIPGLHDKVIPGSTTNSFKCLAASGGDVWYTGSNYNACFNDSNSPQLDILGLADCMAAAEVSIINGLTSYAGLFSRGFYNVFVDQVRAIANNSVYNNVQSYLVTDAHNVGDILHHVYFTHFVTALNACIYQFINRLKASTIVGTNKNAWDGCCILETTEFGREPARDNESSIRLGSSEHAGSATWARIFHPQIDKAMLVGAIKQRNTTSFKGHWGEADVTFTTQGTKLTVGNLHTSVATILGIPSPTPTDRSFLNVNSFGQVTKAPGVSSNNN